MTTGVEPLTFTYEWDFSEHAHLASYLTREYFNRRGWRLTGLLVLACVVGGTGLATAYAHGGPADALIAMSPWLLLIVLWVVFMLYGAGWINAWQVRRQDPSVTAPLTYVLTHSGLHVTARTVDVEVKWSGMHKVRERPGGFLFYYNRRCAYQLPKRAIGSAEQVNAVREFIRHHLPAGTQFVGVTPVH